ncbi:calcium-binding protein [candidate division KSB3 bacterium]|uniref:Calcium-binding protein n=1 Tax=candidate division KSB3 bacterium TaxID=2044937 RepID=A0A2G6E2A7_9BACT|nr:MAG: calcium-binding protein [candidate division KSB3 bacterium]PIE28815.1 MAG: calcium-binding protein [candidate division KSB3 bacterium]
MERLKRDHRREKRIDLEILIDACDEEERAMGWYYYLDGSLTFPFEAICLREHPKSPLQKGDAVRVTGMADEHKCLREIYVQVEQGDEDSLFVPLAQLRSTNPDAQTREALEDWHYWIGRGYGF